MMDVTDLFPRLLRARAPVAGVNDLSRAKVVAKSNVAHQTIRKEPSVIVVTSPKYDLLLFLNSE